MRAAGFLDLLFAFGYAVEVVTYADDFRYAAKESVKRFDHGRRKFYGPLLARDVRRIGVAHEPFGVRVEPNTEAMTLDSLDYLLRHADRQKFLVNNRLEVRLDQHSAVEGGQRLREFQCIDQHGHAARRTSAGNAELDSSFVEALDGFDRTLRQDLFLRNERSVDVCDYHLDWLGRFTFFDAMFNLALSISFADRRAEA